LCDLDPDIATLGDDCDLGMRAPAAQAQIDRRIRHAA